jgi:hypothetical protein
MDPYEKLWKTVHISNVDDMAYMRSVSFVRQILQWVSVGAWPVDRMLKDGTKLLQVHSLVCLKIWQSSEPPELLRGLPADRDSPWSFAEMLHGSAFTKASEKAAKVAVFPHIDSMPQRAADLMESREAFSMAASYAVTEGMDPWWRSRAIPAMKSWKDLTSLHDIPSNKSAEKVRPDPSSPHVTWDSNLNAYLAYIPFADPKWCGVRVDTLLKTLQRAGKGAGPYEPTFYPDSSFSKHNLLFGTMAGSGKATWTARQKIHPRYFSFLCTLQFYNNWRPGSIRTPDFIASL